MNTICKTDINNNDDLFILYNCIRNLYMCEPEYIPLVFKKIENEAKTINNINFLNFIKYFKDTYIKKFNPESWNYYENYRHITNNSCESYNAQLNKLFDKKSNFYKLVYKLKLEEHNIIMAYKKDYQVY